MPYMSVTNRMKAAISSGARIFVINPGSTSTKVALFIGCECRFTKVVRHDPNEISRFSTAASQFSYRYDTVKEIADEACSQLNEGYDVKQEGLESIDAFAGRGGLLKPLQGGTYNIGTAMLEDLESSRYGDHASNLGAMIAAKLGKEFGKPAYVVNPVVVDELMDEARLTGLPEIKRRSVFHALNQKAAAMHAAEEASIDYNKGRFIVAHLGGGISVGAHEFGRVIDVNNGLEEGPFSPERAGNLPVLQLVELCFSGKYSKEEMKKLMVGKGGLAAHTGTTDCKRLESEAENGDAAVKLVFDTMLYRIAREICASAAALCGKIDRIVITGGLAYGKYTVDEISRRVSFLAPISVYPGEDEMTALAEGVLRVLEGKEAALDYVK